MLKGRQIAFMVFERFRLNEEHGHVLDFEDIINVELKNNNTRAHSLLTKGTGLDDKP